MANTIKCPVCGENNSAVQEFCQNCQTRLQPAVGTTKGSDSTIKPGQAPTKKTTAELEPILPQWLRDARDSARNVEPQNNSQQSPQKSEPKQPNNTSEDLLAGLRSQSNEGDEDDTPDWLANITGATPTPKRPSEKSTEARRVELGDMEDFAQEESETPAWLAGLTSTESQADEKDELTDWFRNADESRPMEVPGASSSFDDISPSTSSTDETPDWLRQMAADEDAKKEQPVPPSNPTSDLFPPSSSETPDWLQRMAAGQQDVNQSQTLSSDKSSNEASTNEADTPDWLRQMAANGNLNPPAASADVYNDAPELSIDVPDWLRGIEDNAQSADAPKDPESGLGKSEPPALVSTGELPAWLNDQTDTTPKPTQDTTPKWLKEDAPASVTGELPAWLSASEETVHLPDSSDEDKPAQDDVLGDLPNWLKASAPQSTLFETPTEESVVESAEPAADDSFDSPDWLNAFKTEEGLPPASVPEAESEAALDLPSTFAVSEQSDGNTDDLFTEMPDWLSNAMDLPDSPTPITNTDAIAPGELPSWVQAMRPVDSAPASLSSLPSFSSDRTLESRGALAGLQGVLPSVPGFTPTSKPKPYSIRLHVNEEQLAHAELLEQILAAETAPVPIASFSALRTSRSLRWLLSVLLFAVVITGLVLGTPIFSMPLGVPRELGRAVEISRSLPQGAPVLVAFDFEAALAGEMETAAAPFFDQMIFYSHPKLTFISTNETGSLLAERFVTGPLADHYKNSGFTYSNLGYLPGGQLGIRAFAQNPRGTTPFDLYLQPAWTSTPKELTSLSQLFIAMVLVTDNADAARAWIEQTESARGSLPVVVISSALAAPMIQPYFESQQVRGMVAGLYGGAVFEQNNPGTIKTARTYWDAYSFGMLLAMSLVLGGGMWNLALGLRDRSSAREAK